jgi:hypothetical protein|tara:strand:+ start:439 stop:1152 length:714 start_codon:yes stop_codon:yes gene_type:complete
MDVEERNSAANFAQLEDTLPLPDTVVGQTDRQHLAGFYTGILASSLYNLYVGLGSIDDVDFSAAPATTFPAGTSSGDLVGFGFQASKTYTLVIRPEIAGLETPDISAQTEFVLTAGGEWAGLRPDPIHGLVAEIRPGAVIRLTWDHRIFDGATPTDFEINYGTTPAASGTTTTVTYAGEKRYSKEITLSDGVTYFFKVVARATALESTPVGTLGITADGTAPSAPSITTAPTWQPLQ